MAEQLLHTVTETAGILAIGRTRTFEKVASGEIESVRIGRRRLVPAAAIVEYVERLRAEQSDEGSS